MKKEDIILLLDKYEQGLCSPEEEAIVDAFLMEQEEEPIPGYSEFIQNERSMSSEMNVDRVIDSEAILRDASLLEQEANMGDLYDRYVQAAAMEKSSFDVQKFISEADQLTLQWLEKEAKNMGALYDRYVELSAKEKSSFDVAQFIDQADQLTEEWLAQEEANMDPLYKAFVAEEKMKSSRFNVREWVEEQESAKVIPFRSNRWVRMASIAAIMVMVFSAIFVMRFNLDASSEGDLVMTEAEKIEAEEALQITLAALGMTKHKMDQATSNMAILKEMKHANIFK